MAYVLKWLLGFLAFLLAWTLLTLILTAQLSYTGASWTNSLSVSTLQMLPWFFTSPLILFVSYRFPILYNRWVLHTLLHLLFGFIVLLGASRVRELVVDSAPWFIEVGWVSVGVGERFIEGVAEEVAEGAVVRPLAKDSFGGRTLQRVSETAMLGVPFYLIVLFLCSLARNRREISARDQAALKLESQLTQTQLDLLRMQLQPHFLFNTLNAISTLVYDDPDKADRMVIQLSQLLRRTLDQRNEKVIRLEQEMETLKLYLDIQSMRFGDRMVVCSEVEQETLEMLVPPMILLPLVENAVRYGVEKSSELTTITLAASAQDGRLTLKVIDDGPGVNKTNASGTGVGLANTQSRLETLYPIDRCGVSLIEQEEGEVVATIELPIQTEA